MVSSPSGRLRRRLSRRRLCAKTLLVPCTSPSRLVSRCRSLSRMSTRFSSVTSRPTGNVDHIGNGESLMASAYCWFLTGSQALYGPETLEQVEGQSQAIVNQLNDSPDLPCHVQWKPVLTNSEAI